MLDIQHIRGLVLSIGEDMSVRRDTMSYTVAIYISTVRSYLWKDIREINANNANKINANNVDDDSVFCLFCLLGQQSTIQHAFFLR